MKIDFIGIGASKCATTTIARLLEEHPDICFAVPKEIKYFNNVYRKYKDQIMVNKNFNKSLNWFHNHFSHYKNEKMCGEFSNKYFIDEEAPKRIQSRFETNSLHQKSSGQSCF